MNEVIFGCPRCGADAVTATWDECAQWWSGECKCGNALTVRLVESWEAPPDEEGKP